MIFTPLPIQGAQDSEAQHTAARAERAAQSAAQSAQTLQLEIERLFMITEALWTLLKEQHGYSDQHLEDLVAGIDLRDGKLDGKAASPSPRACPACGRPLSRRRALCVYCGTHTPPSLFDR